MQCVVVSRVCQRATRKQRVGDVQAFRHPNKSHVCSAFILVGVQLHASRTSEQPLHFNQDHAQMSLFLQSVVVGGDTAAVAAEASNEIVEVTLFDLVAYGGWWMIPLVILLVLAIYIFIERYQLIRKVNRDPSDLFNQVQASVRAGDIQGAITACQSRNTAFARMLEKGLQRLGNPLPDITAAIENEGKLEVSRLEKRTALLATIAGAAPMIGFLGTVSGMILAFMKIAELQGNVNPSALAEGIYQAMITTAVGLIVGIPAYFGYNILTSLISSVIYKMEVTTTEFIDLLQEPAK